MSKTMNIKTQLKLDHYPISDLIMLRQQWIITEIELADELYNRGYGEWAVSGFIKLARRQTIHYKEYEALRKTRPVQATHPFTNMIFGRNS